MAQRLVKSTSTVAGFTLLSRILGFLRDIILAKIFGATGLFDAFVVAYKIPNFLRRLFGEGAFSQAFVPILADYRASASEEKVHSFVNHVSGTLAATVGLVVIVFEIAAPFIIMVFAPGFFHDPHRYATCVHLLRILSPYLWLIVLTAFSGAVLNTYGLFAAPAFTPVLLNIAFIGTALLWAPHTAHPIYALGFGVLIGGVAQIAVQLPFLKKIGLIPRFVLGFCHSGTKRVMKRMVPALFGVSVAQISLLVDNVFASFLPAGSISWLYYSDRLIYLPLGVIGVALATVVLPYLSRQHAKKDEIVFSHTLDWALRCALFIGVPSAVGLGVLAGPVLATLFHYGKFNAYDVTMTAKSLRAFSVGLPAFMLVKVLASAFYSRQNIRTPVKVAAVAMISNLVLNALLIVPLKHAGLALATSLSSILNATLLYVLLIKKQIYQPQSQWGRLLFALLFGNTIMAMILFFAAGPLQQWLDWPALSRVLHLLFAIVMGIVSYFFVLWFVGIRWVDFKPIEQGE